MQEQDLIGPSPKVNIKVQKDPSPNNKHVASKNASGFAPLSLSVPKKEKDVESTQTPVAPIYFTQPQSKPPTSHAPLPSQEKKVIPILDPATNKNILEDMSLSSKGNDNTTTPIQSRDFNTANTSALGDAVQRNGPNNHLATEFARSVINRMAMGDETNVQPEPIVNPTVNLNITEKQLKTAEDAWKPSVRKELNEDEIIVRKMRGILDRLTPRNFEKLAVIIKNFKIVEFGTFDSVIDLIFEKAIGEQAFTKTCADLCKGLSNFSFKVKTEKEKVLGELRFKNLLINKCQEEFEKDISKDLQKEERLKKIAEATDPVYKTELTAKLEWDERRLIRRSVGNLRFIGELYKNGTLTSSIMMRIICGLLLKQDEESLECLCTLLSTIGYVLEPQSQASQKARVEFSEVFTTLRKIVDERKTSSHVRFMIMDLIDERDSQWGGRREDAKPKKREDAKPKKKKIGKDIKRRSNPMVNLAPGGMNATHRQVANLNITERQLKTTENAWKPSIRKELKEDEVIVRKMRGILNKLMPHNFEKLTDQITKFKIVEFGTFDSVIGLIFKKAGDDQAFSKTYADLCKVLSQLSIKVKTEKEKEGGEARFRNLLINKCQQEFEKDNSKDLQKEERLKKIAEATDPEYKAELEYDERRLIKRSVGYIRFIGELYKNGMLTSSIMKHIICGLLLKQDEESLECLCTLLSTIGYMLEPQSQSSQKAQAEFSEVFTTLRKIVDERMTSNRVRFMIMDLIDQRDNQWVRREVLEKIRKEKLEQQYLLSSAAKQNSRARKRSRNTRGLIADDNGWNSVICSRRTMYDSSRLKSQTFDRNNNDNDPPVFSAKFSNWATGSAGGSKNHEEDSSRPFINRFAPLELTPMMDMRRSNPMGKLAPGGMNTTHRQGNSFGSKSMPPPSEKEGIHYSKMSSASGDRSKSNSRSSSRQSSRDNSMAPEATTTYRDVQKPVQQKPPLDRNMVEKYTNDLLEEYYSINDINKAALCFQEKFKHHVDILKFVEISFEKVFDKTVEKRAKIGSLYNHLIKHKYLSISQFAEGLKPVLEMLSYYVIDDPQVFSYVGGILCRLLVDNVASLENILTILEPCEKKMDVFAKVIKEASVVLMEATVIELWKSSKINLKALLPEGLSVDEYLTKHEIQFISEASSSECSVVAGEDMPN